MIYESELFSLFRLYQDLGGLSCSLTEPFVIGSMSIRIE